MVVITLDADRQAFAAALNRLRAYVGESIDLLGTDRGPRRFVPRVGMGVVVTDAADALARVLLDEAEQEARQRAGRRGGYAVLRLRGRATVVDGEAIGLKMR